MRIVYKILTVIVAIFWILFGMLAVYVFFGRKYLYPIKYEEIVFAMAEEYELPKELIFATINVESKFKKDAVSSKGAKGLMQITDATADYIADRLGYGSYDIFDESTNIEFGCYYLNYLFSRFEHQDTVIVAYNAGETVVRSWLKNPEYSDNSKTLKEIPYKETREYLRKVKRNSLAYENLQRKKIKQIEKNLIVDKV